MTTNGAIPFCSCRLSKRTIYLGPDRRWYLEDTPHSFRSLNAALIFSAGTIGFYRASKESA
jgi:hypothetical protein